jgi:hypothetical protein
LTSLAAFAAEKSKKKRTCAVCLLPAEILAEVNGAIDDGIGPRLIGHWLQDEKHLSVNERQVAYHKAGRNHLGDM